MQNKLKLIIGLDEITRRNDFIFMSILLAAASLSSCITLINFDNGQMESID